MKRLFVFCSIIICLVSAVLIEKWQRTEDGTLYYLDAEHKYNWFEGWNQCARMNMSLLMVDSLYKHHQIDKMLRKLFSVCPSIWLAAHENAVETRYEWVTTGKPLAFTNWAAGEPNRGYNNQEHCLLIWEKTWEWYDISCWAKSGYICEENSLLKAKDKELDELRESCESVTKYKSIILNVHSNTN